jgi:AAA15 family ATPase/GTPase
MDIKLSIKNYRRFQKPAHITLRKGFISFLGVNNSGKSSILKFFHEFRPIFTRLANEYQLGDVFSGAVLSFKAPPAVFEFEEMFCDRNERDIEVLIEFDAVNPNSKVAVPIKLAVNLSRTTKNWHCKLQIAEHTYTRGTNGVTFNNARVEFEQIVTLTDSSFMHVFRVLSNCMYIGPYRNIINVGTNEDYYDIQVGQSFVRLWRAKKTGNSRSDYKATNQITKDIQNIFDFRSLEINPSNDDQTLQVIINDNSYKLPEVGAGIAQFIIVLANAALRRPSYVLIDEPELNLHPSLQLNFLTTLASYATEGILFSTHSIGLAQASSDVIYSVRKPSEETSEVTEYEATPHLSEFLGELSFSGYRELGFDKVLLVEGPSEVKVIQQWLRLYRSAHKIVLLHLGGDNTFLATSDVELQEIKRISNNIYALIDSELDAANASLAAHRQAFVTRCEQAGIVCKVLERRATENYFTERAIKESVGSQFRELKHYESLNSVTPKWRKKENWRIAREMTLEEIDASDLGQFLKSLS